MPSSYADPVDSVLELVGETPMVCIGRLNPNARVRLFANR
jgi:hypothetical protein